MVNQPAIYLDHAATSWPKAPGVGKVMLEMIEGQVGSSGRGNHGMALVAARKLFRTRSLLAKLFHISNPNDIVFTSNTTEALNLAIKGWLKPGDHVIATMVEHNSVRRPLEFLRRTIGIEVDYIPVSPLGEMEMGLLRSSFRSNTALVVCSHSSNLLGSIAPVRKMSQLAHEYGAVMLLDAAQTAGNYPIDVEELGVDLLAFPGHKGLLGPQGTGGLYISSKIDLVPLLHGGTGSQSEELEQPAVRPDRYEAGTANTVGIAGLGEGVKYILEQGPESIYRHEWELTQRLMVGLSEIPGLTMLGPEIGKDRTGIVSFVIADRDASEVAFLLDKDYGIAVRAGYHCTPLGHMTAGTMKGGAVRASIGYNTVVDDVDALVLAIKRITESY
ncbi:aminotransferase class V-fold PLP-dependent enzyme [Paenibacillus lutimineralis]|uniref:cysteine desulfurase n=1 Tax=Paenibacillus lutimineralis TaxID=2707005 RepID=A0A3Q9IFU0_9BACL|nr:aminotransferase class V-fold PLP-dependent enzyme [Paenibacillus lutimineralis]AZS18040.1 aminotransferase class V-fold PLP-dependent enzyme [Paenibacillus lutimineralis]